MAAAELRIADGSPSAFSTPDLPRGRVFNNTSETAAEELDPAAAWPSCNMNAVAQLWAVCFSHGTPLTTEHTLSSTKSRPHSQYTLLEAAHTGSIRTGNTYGGSTPALVRRGGRGCRSCSMVVGGGHLGVRRYHSLHRRKTETVSRHGAPLPY